MKRKLSQKIAAMLLCILLCISCLQPVTLVFAAENMGEIVTAFDAGSTSLPDEAALMSHDAASAFLPKAPTQKISEIPAGTAEQSPSQAFTGAIGQASSEPPPNGDTPQVASQPSAESVMQAPSQAPSDTAEAPAGAPLDNTSSTATPESPSQPQENSVTSSDTPSSTPDTSDTTPTPTPTPRIGLGVVPEDFTLGDTLNEALLTADGGSFPYTAAGTARVPVVLQAENPAAGSTADLTLSDGAQLVGPNGERGAVWESTAQAFDGSTTATARLVWVEATTDFTLTYTYNKTLSKTISVSVNVNQTEPRARKSTPDPKYMITAVTKVGGEWLITFMGNDDTYCLDKGLDGQPTTACYWRYDGDIASGIDDARAAGCTTKLEIQRYIWAHGAGSSSGAGYVYLPSNPAFQRVLTAYAPDGEAPEACDITVRKVDAENGFAITGGMASNMPARARITSDFGMNEEVDLPVHLTTPGTYTVTELRPALFASRFLGYYNDGASITFTAAAGESGEKPIGNTRQKGQLVVHKIDAESAYINHQRTVSASTPPFAVNGSTAVHWQGDVASEVLTPTAQGDATLAGAWFIVRAKQDITLANGSVAQHEVFAYTINGAIEKGTATVAVQSLGKQPVTAGSIVAIGQTDENGVFFTLPDLDLGLYEVQEICPSEGYQYKGYAPESQALPVEIAYTGEAVKTNIHHVNYENSVLKGHISFTKTQGDFTSGEQNGMGANGTNGVADSETVFAEGVYFAIFLNSKNDTANDEYGNYRPDLRVQNANGTPTGDGNKLTVLPDAFYVPKPLDKDRPLALPTGKNDANDYPIYCLVDGSGGITQTSVNPDIGKPVDANAYNAYYKSLYMVLKTNAQGKASTRDKSTLAWTALGGSLSNATGEIFGAMPLPYGTYTVVELNPNEGYEAVYGTVRIGYESWVDNRDGGYCGLLRRPELGLNNAQPPQVVQNGLWGTDHDLFGGNSADSELNRPITDKTIAQRVQIVKVDADSSPTLTDAEAVAQYESALENWRLAIAALKDTGKYNAAVANGTLPAQPQLSDFTTEGVISAEKLSGMTTYTAKQLADMGYTVSANAKFMLWAWNHVANADYTENRDAANIGDTAYGHWVVQEVGGKLLGAPDAPWVTDTDGVLHFAYPLAYGDYTLVEVAAPYGYWLGDAVNGAVQDIVNWLAGLLGSDGRFDADAAAALTQEQIAAYTAAYAQYEQAFTRWQNDMQHWYAALAQLAKGPAARSYLQLYESRPPMPQAPLRLAHDTLANGNADVAAIKASALYKQHPQLFAWLDDYAPTSNIVNFSIRSTDKTYPLQNATQGTVENDAGHSNAHYAYNKILTLFVANEAQKGYVELTKTGLQLTGAATRTETHNTKPYTLTQPVWQTLGLADARYTITAAADIVTPDGTLRHKAGALVATLVTNADGVAVSQPLHLGEYILQETKAPYGYVLDEMEYPFTLEYQGQNIRIFPERQYFYNIRQNIAVELEKLLETAGAGLGATDGMAYTCGDTFALPHLGSSTATAADGVWYGLFARADIADGNGKTALHAGDLLEVISITGGKGASALDLPLGSFYLQELDNADPAYLIPDTQYDFSFLYTADDQQWVQVCAHANAHDAACNGLHGAEFCTHICAAACMKAMSAKEAYAQSLAGTGKGETVVRIQANGGVTLYNLLKRGYASLFKFDADFSLGLPAGVIMSKPVGEPEITQNGAAITTTTRYADGAVLLETRTPYAVGSHVVASITRADGSTERYEWYALEGAVFGAYDANGVLRATATTDEFGRAVLGKNAAAQRDGLPYGVYTLREISAPDGYRITDASASRTVEITEDGKTVAADITGALLRMGNQIDKPVARLFKYSTSGEALAGAQFTVYRLANAAADGGLPTNGIAPDWQIYTGENGNEHFVYTTNAKGSFTTSYLADGTYRLVETKRPAGYTGSFDAVFTVCADTMARPRILTFSAENAPIPPEKPHEEPTAKPFPQTGY